MIIYKMQCNEIYLKYENIELNNNKKYENESIKFKQEYNWVALEIQLILFESFLKTFINKNGINLCANAILILLLFCGYLNGYKHIILFHQI